MAKKKKKVVRKKATKKKVVKVGKGQIPVTYTTTGGKRYKYNRQRDKDIPNALPPGKRVTKWGTTYYEKRVNRSDAKGSLTGEKHYDTNSHNYNFTISGDMYDIRDRIEKELNNAIHNFNTLKFHKKSLGKQFTQESLLKKYPNYIKSLKKQLREQNKVITSNLR